MTEAGWWFLSINRRCSGMSDELVDSIRPFWELLDCSIVKTFSSEYRTLHRLSFASRRLSALHLASLTWRSLGFRWWTVRRLKECIFKSFTTKRLSDSLFTFNSAAIFRIDRRGFRLIWSLTTLFSRLVRTVLGRPVLLRSLTLPVSVILLIVWLTNLLEIPLGSNILKIAPAEWPPEVA